MTLLLNNTQIKSIADEIEKFEKIELKYNYNLYPPENYDLFKKTFSSLTKNNTQIFDALRWKWGHWNKSNFPKAHQALNNEVESHWNSFIISNEKNEAEHTFHWWKDKLGKNTRYITTAYITHLVHHEKGIAIIDQHNFRAMNYYLKKALPQWRHNKKPSKWTDIEQISSFSKLIRSELNWEASKLDRVLMIYGRDEVSRK
jgi:hypothetical protein